MDPGVYHCTISVQSFFIFLPPLSLFWSVFLSYFIWFQSSSFTVAVIYTSTTQPTSTLDQYKNVFTYKAFSVHTVKSLPSSSTNHNNLHRIIWQSMWFLKIKMQDWNFQVYLFRERLYVDWRPKHRKTEVFYIYIFFNPYQLLGESIRAPSCCTHVHTHTLKTLEINFEC